mgnify:CR=1 FL=1
MWWKVTQEMEIVEIMKYMWWSYNDFSVAPYEIIDTIKIRMSLEWKESKNDK